MKYIDMPRLRIGYLSLFGMALILVIGAFVDVTYQGGTSLHWYVAGLGAVFFLTLMFYGATEFVLKEALDLRPMAKVTEAVFDIGVPETNRPVPVATTSMPNAAAAMMLPAGGLGARLLGPAPSPILERPNPKPAAIPVVGAGLPMPTDLGLAEKKPRPEKIPGAPSKNAAGVLNFELGDPSFLLPVGYKGRRLPGAIQEQTRILCQSCGFYFMVEMEKLRPIAIPCPRCDETLGLSGAVESAEHIKMRCRHCGDMLMMPKVPSHKATQCHTCGQSSD